MQNTISLEQRIAPSGVGGPEAGPVTLVNSFIVDPERDEAFTALWSETSAYFRKQPGYIGLRLHRAVSPTAPYRYVNVARWSSGLLFQAAHETEEFRRLVSQPAWQEFPSRPVLYQVVIEHTA